MSIAIERRHFTVDEYHRMIESGVLREDDRLELLEGEILHMGPSGSRHAACVDRLVSLLPRSVESACILRVQNPIQLEPHSEPVPDVMLVRRRKDYYRDALPAAADTLLVIEVAETSLQLDREIKAPLYARAGIPELWIVDLEHGHIEVHRRPTEAGYRERLIVTPGERVTVPDGPTLDVDLILGLRQPE